MNRRTLTLLAVLFVALAAKADDASTGVPLVSEAHLAADFWLARLDDPDRVVAPRAAVEAQNGKLLRLDPSMHDLSAWSEPTPGARVSALVEGLASAPSGELYDDTGNAVPAERLAGILANRNLDAIPAMQPTRFGLVVRRADLRTFPTALRVFRSTGNTDIDRFQESALFPGTPVIIAHESGDGQWWFVVSPRYAAWIEKRQVAEGDAEAVLAYLDRSPYRIVTGATVKTVFNPEQAAVSELQLDMGVRVPVAATHPADAPVHGQHPYSSHVIELPVRADEGTLQFQPALLPKQADTAADFLPLTRGNIVRQGFKFLGERYGWGHSYNGRDCSGFVSEVYRSMGAMLPRNTSAQSVSPALQKRLFGPDDSREERIAALRELEAGDLVYIPGHVMMVIGKLDGEPWVIHDTTGISYATEDGDLLRVRLNAVSVTPLMPLRVNEKEFYFDRVTSIVKVVPEPAKEAPPSP